MNRDVCEHFNPVDMPCAKCEEKRKSEALFLADELEIPLGTVIQSEVCHRAAKELRRLHAELERCKQVCAATSEAWREEAALAEPVQKPVAGRAFFERILAAMEGVIDVADRKTDEFDALRSCVIDLTLMLHTAPQQRKPLTEEEIWALYYALPSDDFERSDRIDFARAIERAHGIGGNDD